MGIAENVPEQNEKLTRQNIEGYAESIEGSPSLVEKIVNSMNIANEMCPEDILDVFISEKTRTNGNLQPNSAWFFSNKYILESKNVLSSNINMDIISHYKYITRYEIYTTEYNFSDYNDNSLLRIEGFIESTLFDILATRNNCNNLWEIIKKHIVPNIFEYEV